MPPIWSPSAHGSPSPPPAAGVGDFTATLSAGVARAHRTSTIDSLMKAADQALYRAKSNGRNRVELAEPVGRQHTVAGFAEPKVA